MALQRKALELEDELKVRIPAQTVDCIYCKGRINGRRNIAALLGFGPQYKS